MHSDAFRFILMHCNTRTFRTWSTIDQILLKVAPNVAGECVLVTVVPFPRSVRIHVYMLQHVFIEDIEAQMKLQRIYAC